MLLIWTLEKQNKTSSNNHNNILLNILPILNVDIKLTMVERSYFIDPLSYLTFLLVLNSCGKNRPWYVLSCLFYGVYKIFLAANRKK